MKKLSFILALLCASMMGMAQQASQCSGDLGHFGTPATKRISYTIEYLPWADKIRYTVRGYDTQVLDFCQIQTTSGNSGYLAINEGVAVWQQNAPAANTEMGILFLYSTDQIGGNEMNAETCALNSEGIVYYKSHDCETLEPEPEPDEIYNVNFALTSNGASASAKSGNNANEAIDNNPDSRWYSATDGGMTDEQKNDQWWQVDLGERRIFNLVQILWEGAYGKSFDIQKSNDGTNWTTIKEIRDQSLSGFPYLQEINFAANDTARYIRFQGITRGTAYAYSFWEFRVFLVSERVLTSYELNASHTLAGTNPKVALAPTTEGIALTVTGKDQIGSDIDAGEYNFEFSSVGVGSVVGGKLVAANIGGPATITAKNGSVVSNALTFYGYAGENLSQGKTVEASSADPGNPATNAVDNNEGSLWSAFAANTDGKEYNAWIIVDLAAFYDINLIAIRWEGACSKHYHVDFSADKEHWRTAYNAGWSDIATHWEYLFGTLEDATKVRYVRVYSTEAVSNYGIKIMDLKVFGIPYVPAGDTEKPVMGEASLVSNTWNSAVIAVDATDNEEIGSYRVVDASKEFNNTFVPSDDKITVTGLTQDVTYNFTITAIDLADNESENSANVAVTTKTYLPKVAAPTPSKDQSSVMSLYSDSYDFAPASLVGYNQSWWQNPNLTNETIGENHYLHYDLYRDGMIGAQFASISVSEMQKLHLDIYASAAGSVTFRLITNEVPAVTTSKTLELEEGEWNSFDIALTDFGDGHDWTTLYQFAIERYYAGGLVGEHISVDNIYLYKETATSIDNTNAEVKAIKVIENGQLVIIKNGVRYNVVGSVVK